MYLTYDGNHLPYCIPEYCKLIGVRRIKLESWLGVNENTRIESTTTKHDCRLHMWVSIEHDLYGMSVENKGHSRKRSHLKVPGSSKQIDRISIGELTV